MVVRFGLLVCLSVWLPMRLKYLRQTINVPQDLRNSVAPLHIVNLRAKLLFIFLACCLQL